MIERIRLSCESTPEGQGYSNKVLPKVGETFEEWITRLKKLESRHQAVSTNEEVQTNAKHRLQS